MTNSETGGRETYGVLPNSETGGREAYQGDREDTHLQTGSREAYIPGGVPQDVTRCTSGCY